MVEKNSFEESYKLFWENVLNFNGRTRRSDFWQPLLINVIIAFVLELIFDSYTAQSVITLLLGLSNLSCCIRRLHDIGKKWTWYLIGLIPLVGLILLIVWYAQDSDHGTNAFGPSPKYPDML